MTAFESITKVVNGESLSETLEGMLPIQDVDAYLKMAVSYAGTS